MSSLAEAREGAASEGPRFRGDGDDDGVRQLQECFHGGFRFLDLEAENAGDGDNCFPDRERRSGPYLIGLHASEKFARVLLVREHRRQGGGVDEHQVSP